MAYRLVIDRNRCENNGYCMQIATTLIRPDSDGAPDIIATDIIDDALVARSAVRACPMSALRLEYLSHTAAEFNV